MARTTLGSGHGGEELAEHVVRWERNGNKINLPEVNYDLVADPKTPISLAVKAANNETMIMTLPADALVDTDRHCLHRTTPSLMPASKVPNLKAVFSSN